MISISKGTGFIPAKHTHFKPYTPSGGNEFCEIITNNTWSPIIWEQGHRLSANFVTCEYLALDFDEGWSIEEALTWGYGEGFKFIIGTTRNHQKVKTSASGVSKPACDRFRMVIPFSRPIDDLDEYLYNMVEIMKIVPTDIACKDGGRLFFPCTKIAHCVDGGTYEVKELTDKMRKESTDGLVRYKAKLATHAKNKTIPYWVTQVIMGVTPEGSRNPTTFKVAAALQQCGKSIDWIYLMLSETNLMDMGEKELRTTISNGFNTAASEDK